MNIGANIKRLRKEAGLNQKELGLRLQISDKTISSWETNRTEPDMDAVMKMCNVFRCRCTDIMGNDGFVPDLSYVQLSDNEMRLLTYYRYFNDAGKEAAMSCMEGLAKKPCFLKDTIEDIEQMA